MIAVFFIGLGTGFIVSAVLLAIYLRITDAQEVL